MQEWLDNNDILMYFTHNEDKAVIAVRFKGTLKSKIYIKITGLYKNYIIWIN